LPFKASFRRFEDDDDFDSDAEDQSETDLQSHFMQEDVNSIMHQLSTQPKHQKRASITVKDWNAEDVLEWLSNFGKANYNDSQRFVKYEKIFTEYNIDGAKLRQINKKQLEEMGVDANDIQDLYRGIQQLNSIIFAVPNNGNLGGALKDVQDSGNGDEKHQEEEEEDNWEAPFLPYMYDAPQIKLSENTSVKVYSSRVVSPYKKKAFALYELEVIEGKDEWLLSKRYSEFYKLYEQMKKLGVKTKFIFPKKGIFYKSTDKQVMEDRKKKLTSYLNELLKDHDLARKSKELSDFLSPSRTFVVDE